MAALQPPGQPASHPIGSSDALRRGKLDRRHRFETLRAQLEIERASFLSHWRDLGDYILPRRPRFTAYDVNRGDRRSQKIINSTATLALRTLRSGMMAGITSPARPWFRLGTPNQDLMQRENVKDWLYTVTERMRMVFLRSNVYNALPILYGDMGTFGTSAMAVEEDFDHVIRCYPFPIGTYSIANDDRMKVRVFFREFRYTVRQIVEKFGIRDYEGGPVTDWSNISTTIQNLFERGLLEAWVDVRHVIIPNADYDPRKIHSKYKKYSSVYYEIGVSGTVGAEEGSYANLADPAVFLREAGYDYFPVLAPRWEVNAEDVYAVDCPGMTALGDIRQLQVQEKRGSQALEKMVNPPLKGPSSLRSVKVSLLPGDISYTDERDGQKGLTPIHEVNLRLSELENKNQQIQNRISRAFYEDLFLMLASEERTQPITAREVEEKHQEKLLALGPVLEQLNQDLLDPLVEITFAIMQRQGMIPPPPQELAGQPLRVEYVSIMAEAQKLLGIAGLERFSAFIAQIVPIAAQAIDKVDIDQLIEKYGEMTSVPPGVIASEDVVQAKRQAAAQAQQAQAQAEQAQKLSAGVKSLSGADMTGDNALTRLMQQGNAGKVTPNA